MARPKRHRDNIVVGEQGRIVIPARLRHELGIKPGDELMARVIDGQLVLQNVDEAFKDLQKAMRRLHEGRSLVDELTAERRAEIIRELAEEARRELVEEGIVLPSESEE